MRISFSTEKQKHFDFLNDFYEKCSLYSKNSILVFLFVADKVFFSQENIDLFGQQNLQYIIPLRRNNPLIDYSPLLKANPQKEIGNYFSYQDRIIWHYQYKKIFHLNINHFFEFISKDIFYKQKNMYL